MTKPKQKPLAYVGIDPGKNGAAALLAPDKIHLHDYEGPQKAYSTLAAWRDQYRLFAAMEKVGGFKGDASAYAFRFGENFGVWRTVCVVLSIKLELVHPATWQCVYLPGWNKKGVDNKKAAIEIVRRIHPAVKSAIYLKKHNGRADALLLASFAKGRGLK